MHLQKNLNAMRSILRPYLGRNTTIYKSKKGLAVRNRCHRVSANDPTYGRVSSFFVADCVFLYNKMEQGPEFGAALYI